MRATMHSAPIRGTLPSKEYGTAIGPSYDTVSVAIGGCSRAKGSVNEDAYLVEVGHSLFGVFDGLGATAQAAQAAELAVEAIRAAYREHGPGDDCAAERAFLALAVGGAGTLIATSLADGSDHGVGGQGVRAAATAWRRR